MTLPTPEQLSSALDNLYTDATNGSKLYQDPPADVTLRNGDVVPNLRKRLQAVTDAADQLGSLEAARDDARAWAEGTLPGGAGTKSAREHSADAAALVDEAKSLVDEANSLVEPITAAGLALKGNGGKVMAVNAGGTALEFLTASGAGKAILAGADAAAQRATLGLGTVTTFAEEVTDLNAITASGWARFAPGAANAPFATGAGMVLTIFFDGSAAVQLVWGHNKGESDTGQWIRWRASSAWVGWVRLYGSNSEIRTGVLNASGNAPTFACRAWVNFNGTGTPSIRAAGNVSSITDNGVGDYTVNFATAMPDANYTMTGSLAGGDDPAHVRVHTTVAPTTSSCRVLVQSYSGVQFDDTRISLMFVR